MKMVGEDGGPRLAEPSRVTRLSRRRPFVKRRKNSPFHLGAACPCGAGPSSFHSAAPRSAGKSITSCFGSHWARWLSDTRYERLTVTRASSRRGGGHSGQSKRRLNKCFPRI